MDHSLLFNGLFGPHRRLAFGDPGHLAPYFANECFVPVQRIDLLKLLVDSCFHFVCLCGVKVFSRREAFYYLYHFRFMSLHVLVDQQYDSAVWRFAHYLRV